MGFTLGNVVPWGRSFDEYVSMFALTPDELLKSVLDCAGGPSSFNACLTRRSRGCISVDPLYRFSAVDIRRRIEAVVPVVMEQIRKNTREFVWDSIPSVEDLETIRLSAMNAFLDDYSTGSSKDRYMDGSLPELPFSDETFDLALCSHFLFLYSALLLEEFHVASIRELCRVAKDVRIFPLLELGTQKSRHLAPVLHTLSEAGYDAEIIPVPYEFQRGGNAMLRVRAL